MIGAALLATLVVLQRVCSAPLVPSSIFRAPNLTIGNIVMALLGAAWIPMWSFLNMYLQEVLGYGAFESGLVRERPRASAPRAADPMLPRRARSVGR